jgi:hypothetical protein
MYIFSLDAIAQNKVAWQANIALGDVNKFKI